MEYFGLGILVFGFFYLFDRLYLISYGRGIFRLTNSIYETIRSKDLDDDSKEALIQGIAVKILIKTGLVILGGVVCLVIPFLFVWGMELLGMLTIESVMDLTISFRGIVFSLGLSVIFFMIQKKKAGR